jgi:tRNA threonylcarbamoyladenosine biosynthesis protein TsaB
LDELLQEHNLKVTDITHIRLETGPGSFTGLRVGAVIAATLSAVLRIPINDLPPGNIPELNYGEDLWGLKKTTTS